MPKKKTKSKTAEKDCVFCKILAGEIKTDMIEDAENFVVFNDANPVSDGHCLVVPKKHYKTLLDLPATLGCELIALAKKQGLRLIKEKKAEGIKLIQNNFSAAGQIVPHFHLHIIPEKEGKVLYKRV